MAMFDLPATAQPGKDVPVAQDELGRTVYRTFTGEQYTMPEPPRMAPKAAGPMQGPLAYASPQRMAEMRAYAEDLRGMQGSYSAEDMAAAGYSPMEIAALSTAKRSAMPFSQEADRDRQRAPADVLQEPDLTMRYKVTGLVQNALIEQVGMDTYNAGMYARRIMGDPNASGILESLGLIDIASMLGGGGSLAAKGIGMTGRAVAAAPAALSGMFNVEEGTQTAQRGYQEGSALQTGLGAVQAVAGMAEMFPASKLIAEGIARNVSRIDPNTLFSVFGPPMPPQPLRAPDTGAGSGRPPLTFDEVQRAMQEAPPAVAPVTMQGADEILNLADDDFVTLYHGTTTEGAEKIRQTGTLKSAGEPSVYLTTDPTGGGYGDGTVVPVRVRRGLLQIDDEFPSGRADFRIDLDRPGGSVPVQIAETPAAPAQSNVQDIEGTLQAKYPDVKLSISGSPERGYTLNKIDVPKGKRESGIGTAVMNDLVNLADQQGVVLKLSPSGDFGGSVPRLKDFYARFGFVQNKGRNADYAISESMYRNPASVVGPQ